MEDAGPDSSPDFPNTARRRPLYATDRNTTILSFVAGSQDALSSIDVKDLNACLPYWHSCTCGDHRNGDGPCQIWMDEMILSLTLGK